jgi:hypothetical protein
MTLLFMWEYQSYHRGSATAPNPLSTQIQAPMSPILNGTEAHGTRHGHSTQHPQIERSKEQRLLYLCATGKLFPPDKEEDGHARGHLLVFLFYFSPLYHECNPSHLLISCKKRGRGHV